MGLAAFGIASPIFFGEKNGEGFRRFLTPNP